ncbi:MAG TPA: hypothetical protein VN258_06240 [Mobilitalea sp.]|nr:hypothetical protein [Mobilitalea sp.]
MKTGNMSTALKLILVGVSVLVTCVFVKVVLLATEEARHLSMGAIEQMNDMNNDIVDSGIMKYNDDVQGSDVVNCIKKYLGDYTSTQTAPIYVYVKTSVSENTYTNSNYIPNIRNFSDTRFIKPTAMFTGQVMKNTNDVIIGIKFIQK